MTQTALKCINCQNCYFNKQVPASKKMLKHQFLSCKKLPSWHFVSLSTDRQCKDFKQETTEKIKSRLNYCDKIKHE